MRACLLTLVLATCTAQPPVDAGPRPQPTAAPPEVEPWFVAADVALVSRPASVEELQPWIAVDSLRPTDTLPGVVFASYARRCRPPPVPRSCGSIRRARRERT